MVIFKNPQDNSQFSTIARQIRPDKVKFLVGSQRRNIIFAYLLDARFKTRQWRKVSSEEQHFWRSATCVYSTLKDKRIICKVAMELSACLGTLRRFCLVDSVKLFFQSTEKNNCLRKHLKLDKIKAISECAINIIDKNNKVSDKVKREINRNVDKIRELLNPRTSQKK